jgi:DNA polymerase I-like protein with 3'-5' exonuclease and polymerase domains
MVIVDNPMEVETRSQLAFSAPSAKELSMHLHKAGLGRDVVHMTYLFNFRIPKGDPKDLFHTAGLAVTDYHSWEQSKKESILNFAHNTLKNLRDEIHTVSPDLIICTGRWGLYFLSGETSVLETAKSPYGTLIKWRASKLKLGSFWDFHKPHILIPILPPSAKHQLPEKKKIIEHDLSKRIQYLGKKVKEGTFVEACVEERYSFLTRPDFDTVMTWLHHDLERLDNADAGLEFAIDVETCSGFHNCISIARDGFTSICIPWCTLDNPYYWTEVQEFEIVKMLKKIFLHKNFRSVGQNFWYDMQYIERDLGILIKSDVDTMVMQTVLFTALEKSLDFLASLYCQHYKYWKGDGIGTAGRGKTDIQNWIRNCKDTCFTFEAAQVMKQILAHSDPKLQRAYKNQIERVVPMVHAMNRRGVRQDSGQKAKLKAEFTIVKEQAQKELDYILGERLNINSPAQIQTLLYDIYRLPVQHDPKTKRPSAGHEALELLGGIEPLCRPIVRRISELSQISKLLSTYLEAKPDIDGRMRSGYGWTDSFRFTSSKDAFHTGCMPANKAEALTPEGWRPISSRPPVIMQADTAGNLQYVRVDWNLFEYSGLMYDYSGRNFKGSFTPDHRILQISSKGIPSTRLAKDAVKLKFLTIPVSGNYQGTVPSQGSDGQSWLRLLVAFSADGNLEGNAWRIAVSKERKKLRLLELLKGREYTENKAAEGFLRVRVKNEDWTKVFPAGLLNLCLEDRRVFIQELQFWDSTVRGDSFRYYSTIKENVDLVTTLCHISGYSASVSIEEDNNRGFGQGNNKTLYTLNISPKIDNKTEGFRWSTSQFSGIVGCPTTPSGFWLVRYDGGIHITGNSNRQNIPKASETMRGRALPNLRKLDIPDFGMEMFDIDLDSADLRIVTAESGAKSVQAMFDAGAKPYIEMMKQFYHDPKKNKHSKEYKTFKAICHALNYCGSAAGIAARVGMLVHDVDTISKFWFSANPEIKTNYHERLRREIFGRGYIENSFGFRRPFWNLSEPNIMQIAAPWIPSSSVSHLTIAGMVDIHEQEPEIQILLNVHDSCVGQFPVGRTEEFTAKIKKHFTREMNYPSKLIIPVDIVTSTESWGAVG